MLNRLQNFKKQNQFSYSKVKESQFLIKKKNFQNIGNLPYDGLRYTIKVFDIYSTRLSNFVKYGQQTYDFT